jgi:hypothetical protein
LSRIALPVKAPLLKKEHHVIDPRPTSLDSQAENPFNAFVLLTVSNSEPTGTGTNK